MQTIFIRHPVADYDTWRPGFDDHGATRREHGLTDGGVYRDADDANLITLVLTTDDMDRAHAFLGSDDLRETMTKLGVTGPPEVWVTTAA